MSEQEREENKKANRRPHSNATVNVCRLGPCECFKLQSSSVFFFEPKVCPVKQIKPGLCGHKEDVSTTVAMII